MMKPIGWLEELLASLPPALEEPPPDDDPDSHFDPDHDNLGDVIDWLWARLDEERKFYGEGQEGQWAEALKWLNDPVGLDFSDLQARWNQIPVIPVQKHLSDKYGLDEPRGLFGYLDQIRLAYVVGADLAAIALCRTTTELLVRYHYASHVPNAVREGGR